MATKRAKIQTIRARKNAEEVRTKLPPVLDIPELSAFLNKTMSDYTRYGIAVTYLEGARKILLQREVKITEEVSNA